MLCSYGACVEFQRATGFPLSYLSQDPILHWQHGWHPQIYNSEPELVIGEDGRSTENPHHIYLVGRKDQETALESQGFTRVRAIGLPFAYALKNQLASFPRKAGSVLVMPAGHATSESRNLHWAEDDQYIEYLKYSLVDFEKTEVVLHQQDLLMGRGKRWLENGFFVHRGASVGDHTSLRRLAKLLQMFDVVATNDIGSHVAYAAASGCRVSISGPRFSMGPKDLLGFNLYRNNPHLADQHLTFREKYFEGLRSLQFIVEPKNAQIQGDWGLRQIGFDNVLDETGTRYLLSFFAVEAKPRFNYRLLAAKIFWPISRIMTQSLRI